MEYQGTYKLVDKDGKLHTAWAFAGGNSRQRRAMVRKWGRQGFTVIKRSKVYIHV